MASPSVRLAILGACVDTFQVLIDGLHFEPRWIDEFSKRRVTPALRQPVLFCLPQLPAPQDSEAAAALRQLLLLVPRAL